MYFYRINLHMSNASKMRRMEKFRALSHQYNLVCQDTDEFGVVSFLKYFNLHHRNGKITNLCISKSEDFKTTYYIFDYTFNVQLNNYRKIYKQTIFFTRDSHLHLPVFLLKPENVGHKIASYFGWEDINFETHPHFSDTYHLTGEDEAWIRDSFDEQVLSFFSKTSGWHIEAANHFLLFYSLDSLIPENILFDFFKIGKHVHQLFKESQKELKPI